MRNFYKTVGLCFLLFSFTYLKAQPFFKRSSLGVQFHYGSFLTHSSKAVYLKDSYSYFGEAYLRQQSYFNHNGVHQIIPWGYGVFWGQTGSRQFMGSMCGAFAFTYFPLMVTPAIVNQIRAGVGMGWVQKPYNKDTNHKNVLIGTHLNGYVNFLWQNEFRITQNWLVNAGLSFSHLSNGGTTLPNLGLNIPAFSLGLRYKGAAKHFIPKLVSDSFQKKISVTLFTSAGSKQRPWIGSRRYLVNMLQAEVHRPMGYYNQLGGGLAFFYDRSLQVDPSTITSNKRAGSLFQAGVYGSFEHTVGRFSIPIQIGAYLFNKYEFTTLFQQLGVRYHISSHWQSQVLLKTHAGKADVFQAGLGYVF